MQKRVLMRHLAGGQTVAVVYVTVYGSCWPVGLCELHVEVYYRLELHMTIHVTGLSESGLYGAAKYASGVTGMDISDAALSCWSEAMKAEDD